MRTTAATTTTKCNHTCDNSNNNSNSTNNNSTSNSTIKCFPFPLAVALLSSSTINTAIILRLIARRPLLLLTSPLAPRVNSHLSSNPTTPNSSSTHSRNITTTFLVIWAICRRPPRPPLHRPHLRRPRTRRSWPPPIVMGGYSMGLEQHSSSPGSTSASAAATPSTSASAAGYCI